MLSVQEKSRVVGTLDDAEQALAIELNHHLPTSIKKSKPHSKFLHLTHF
jgi:hypothetical protein